MVPEQDLEPWVRALRELLTDEPAYWAEAERSRTAALNFVSGLEVADFEKMLLALQPAQEPIRPAVKNLDAAKRALLLARLRHKKDAS